jgi:hypothetical protein
LPGGFPAVFEQRSFFELKIFPLKTKKFAEKHVIAVGKTWTIRIFPQTFIVYRKRIIEPAKLSNAHHNQ